jgi:hypothetical protein
MLIVCSTLGVAFGMWPKNDVSRMPCAFSSMRRSLQDRDAILILESCVSYPLRTQFAACCESDTECYDNLGFRKKLADEHTLK